jgi:Ca2+/Na+ antiporter
MSLGLVGGVVGSLVGVAGGVVGTVASIRRTRGVKERRFAVRCSVVMWLSIALFLCLLFVLPPAYRWYLWVAYAILLPVMVAYWSHRQRELRAEDAAEQSPDGD